MHIANAAVAVACRNELERASCSPTHRIENGAQRNAVELRKPGTPSGRSALLENVFLHSSAVAVGLLWLGSGSAAIAAEDLPKRFNIEGQALADAVMEFGMQSGSVVVAPAALTNGKNSAPVSGDFTSADALRILLRNSGLTFATSGDGTITVASPATVAPPAKETIRTASAGPSPETDVTAGTELTEVVVTGSRIVRDGYEAPTPLSVIGGVALKSSADANIANYIATMPAFAGAGIASGNSTGLSNGSAGTSNINLRALGASRTLVLLDGQRTVGALLNGVVDVSAYPQQLISRVDIVTGGASAVYGSDAVAGVVNFVLDKEFTGYKAEVAGGATGHGDKESIDIQATAGIPFAGGRGHFLLSGQEMFDAGIQGDGGRNGNGVGYQIISNPNYTPTNGQPARLVLNEVGTSTATFGGVVVSGPLRGTGFGAGGSPYSYQYGDLVSDPYMRGGDWQSSDLRSLQDLSPRQRRHNIFTRISYDVGDSSKAYFQSSWNKSHVTAAAAPIFMIGNAGPLINVDNAFLPESVRTSMLDAGLPSVRVGTWNLDLGMAGTNNTRTTTQNTLGMTGSVDVFNTAWQWDAHAGHGVSRNSLRTPGMISRSRYALATDAVINPADGSIVCRSTLSNPDNGCSPWNPLGVGVNGGNSAGYAYLSSPSTQDAKIRQTVFAASVSGEPLDVPAGPVSLALSMEHRIDSIDADPDAGSVALDHPFANMSSLHGKQNVTEGALETVVPLLKDLAWVDNWDLSGAVRFTDYSLSGFATTWKVGTTFSPVPDVKFRLTRSRDIRAPNIQELFQPVSFINGPVFDPATNTSPIIPQLNLGNRALTPEEADTTGLGVVLRPSFLSGFSMSVDYWEVNIEDAITAIAAADLVRYCLSGDRPEFCPNVTRVNGILTGVTTMSINAALQEVRGIDVEGTYQFELQKLHSSIPGTLGLHANFTRYLRNYQDDSISTPTNHVGENAVGVTATPGPPSWKLSAAATYEWERLTTMLSARALSSGKINSEFIQCTSGCPASTAAHNTINLNRMPGAFYLDASIQYAFDVADVESVLFISVRNILNRDPPPVPGSQPYDNLYRPGSALYDTAGTEFRAGVRFKM